MACLRKHTPVPADTMNVESPVDSICEILRQIYHATDDENIKWKARLATAMAKSMDKKLMEYKVDWFHDYWDEK
jgi:hypothetical protein